MSEAGRRRTAGRGLHTARGAALLVASWAVALTGCASGGNLTASADQYGSGSPQAAIRSFMEASENHDYEAMSQQFGTSDGPAEARFGAREVEQRMVALAKILEHRSYSLRPADLLQVGPKTQKYVMRLTGTRKGTVDVPVIVARTGDGKWFVQQLVLDELTKGTEH